MSLVQAFMHAVSVDSWKNSSTFNVLSDSASLKVAYPTNMLLFHCGLGQVIYGLRFDRGTDVPRFQIFMQR